MSRVRTHFCTLVARGPRRGLLAEEVRLERHHAGVDEQQVGVVEQQRRARDDGVAALAEELQPPTLDLGGLHQRVLLGVLRVSRRARTGR